MILLDTHMVLALLGQADLNLPPAVSDELRSRSRKFASVATVWEMAIKYRLNKLKLAFDIKDLPKLLEDIDVDVVDITAAHTLAEIGPDPLTKDPFDRLLLGVCAVESMRLLTIDRALIDHPLAWRRN